MSVANRRKQRILMNVLVLVAFLILGGLVVSQSLSGGTTNSANVSAPIVAPTNNAIVEENQKPGSDKWKSPNQDDYLKNMADEQKGRMEGTRSAADR
jgi:hypothetical protein